MCLLVRYLLADPISLAGSAEYLGVRLTSSHLDEFLQQASLTIIQGRSPQFLAESS